MHGIAGRWAGPCRELVLPARCDDASCAALLAVGARRRIADWAADFRGTKLRQVVWLQMPLCRSGAFAVGFVDRPYSVVIRAL